MAVVPGEPPVRVGQVLRLAEEDYRFGVGTLTLRVTGLLHVQELDDGPWLYLRGTAIRWDGGDGESRQVLVRLSALRGGASSTPGMTLGVAPEATPGVVPRVAPSNGAS